MKKHPEQSRGVAEGFQNERLVLLPQTVIKRMESHPITRMLYPTRIGYFPSAVGHAILRPKGIPDHLLIHCQAGKGRGWVDQQEFTLQPGEVVILKAGKAHGYEADESEPWSIIWIHFRGKLALDYMDEVFAAKEHPVIRMRNFQRLREDFEVIYGLTQGQYSDPTLLNLHTSLARFLSLMAHGRREQLPGARDRSERIDNVIRFLRNNLHRSISISEMAAVAHWTPNHFATLFREQLQETPGSFFLNLKMQYACELLLQPGESVGSVAEALGYQDPFYFSRSFKRCFQVSPRQYQQAGIPRKRNHNGFSRQSAIA